MYSFFRYIYCFFYILLIRFVSIFRKNNYFPNDLSDKDILVIGNGPSLKDVNLCEYKNKGVELCCVNFFPIKDERFVKLKPKYLCLLDPIFFAKDNCSENVLEMIKLINSIDWDITLLIPQHKSIEIKNSHVNIQNLNSTVFWEEKFDKLCFELYKKNILSCGYQNVIVGALYYFISCHVRTVYVCGIDMNEFLFYKVDENNDVYIELTHFYGTELRKATLFPKGNMHQYLLCYQKMLEQFSIISKYANYENVKIYNLSKYSYVDVFEKI